MSRFLKNNNLEQRDVPLNWYYKEMNLHTIGDKNAPRIGKLFVSHLMKE